MRPFDLDIRELALRWEPALPGDLRREWMAIQQFGQTSAVLLTGLLIFVCDPARRRRLFDLALSLAVGAIPLILCRSLIVRLRPRPLIDETGFFWRFSETALPDAASGDVASFPSGHALYAGIVAAFLGEAYPKLKWVFLFVLLIVGAGRVAFSAHWCTDVLAGMTTGWLIGTLTTRNSLGVRLFSWIRSIFRPDQNLRES